jgi:hypothetical protein
LGLFWTLSIVWYVEGGPQADIQEFHDGLRTTYFQGDDGFYQQKDGMAMGSSLSPVVSIIYMEHFEQLAVDSAQDKPSLWLRYMDDTFINWPQGAEWIQNFLKHLNILRQAIQFNMELELEK